MPPKQKETLQKVKNYARKKAHFQNHINLKPITAQKRTVSQTNKKSFHFAINALWHDSFKTLHSIVPKSFRNSARFVTCRAQVPFRGNLYNPCIFKPLRLPITLPAHLLGKTVDNYLLLQRSVSLWEEAYNPLIPLNFARWAAPAFCSRAPLELFGRSVLHFLPFLRSFVCALFYCFVFFFRLLLPLSSFSF